MKQAWYIIASRKQDELELLLERMGVEFFNPTGLQPRVARQKLQLKQKNIMGGYVFAKLDIEQHYYYLKHNEMFYGNVIAVLGMDNEFAATEDEINAWKHVADMAMIPLLMKLRNGRFAIAGEEYAGATLIRYYRRKCKAVLEVSICGIKHRITVAAYDKKCRTQAARELAAMHRVILRERASDAKNRFLNFTKQLKESLKLIREKMQPAPYDGKRHYFIMTERGWRIAPWAQHSFKVLILNDRFKRRFADCCLNE